MPTFTRKTFASYYKNLFGINQSGNTGIDNTSRNVQDGDGKNTSISLSKNHLNVKPENTNSSTTFNVKTLSGASLLTVDTSNNDVLAGVGQVSGNRNYVYFSAQNITPAAGYHMIIPFNANKFVVSSSDDQHLGNGTDPSTSLDISAQDDSIYFANLYWHVVDAITIEAVSIVAGGSQASGDALNFHLMKYNIDTGSNPGDLSSGLVVADGGALADMNEDKILLSSLTIDSDNKSITNNQILLLTVESDSTDPISINATIKFNIT